jgi:tetratricopeptide (TPR) repeat protein
LAAAGEGNAGRARAALVYALAKSGDVAGAKAELAKLDTLARPYPVLPNLHALVDKTAVKPSLDAGAAAGSVVASAVPGQTPPSGAPPPPPAGAGESAPLDARGGMQAASQAIKKGDYPRAREIYDAIVARNPTDSEAVAGLGDVARSQGDTAGAITAYKRAIGMNPSYLPALLGLADTEWMSGDHASAVRRYTDIQDRFPEGTYPAYVKQRAEGGGSAPKGPSAPKKPSAAGSPDEPSE